MPFYPQCAVSKASTTLAVIFATRSPERDVVPCPLKLVFVKMTAGTNDNTPELQLLRLSLYLLRFGLYGVRPFYNKSCY